MKKMKIFAFIFFSFSSTAIWSQTVASCGESEGVSHYHYATILSKKNSGFTKDRITNGMISVQKMPDGSYDILLVDVRKKILSMVQDGGKVGLLRKGNNDATFMLYFPNNSIEIFTFWIDAEGNKRYDHPSSKGGDATLIHKSSVLTGQCDEINLIEIN